jgi:hypothetical protein
MDINDRIRLAQETFLKASAPYVEEINKIKSIYPKRGIIKDGGYESIDTMYPDNVRALLRHYDSEIDAIKNKIIGDYGLRLADGQNIVK